MLYRYKCRNCGVNISLFIEKDSCRCPECDGELSLCADQNQKYYAIIKHLFSKDGRRILIIDTPEKSKAFEYRIGEGWQPLTHFDQSRPLGDGSKIEGRVF